MESALPTCQWDGWQSAALSFSIYGTGKVAAQFRRVGCVVCKGALPVPNLSSRVTMRCWTSNHV